MQATMMSRTQPARRVAGRAAAPRGVSRMALRVRAFQEDKAPGPADTKTVEHKTEPKVSRGQRLPLEMSVWTLRDSKPAEVQIGDLLKGKKVVLFGLPGAYTSVCSSKHVPEYQSKLGELRSAGVEEVICMSVNDVYVMAEWAQKLGVNTSEIQMVGDPDASFHERLGLTQVLPGLGTRARRYSMFIDDGEIKVLNLEEPGGMSYKVSGPSHMLGDLKASAQQQEGGSSEGGETAQQPEGDFSGKQGDDEPMGDEKAAMGGGAAYGANAAQKIGSAQGEKPGPHGGKAAGNTLEYGATDNVHR